MQTKRLSAGPDAVAPDGSHVRLLAGVRGGGLAHFELAPGQTSIAVRHRTVEELWFFLEGRGEMWRRDASGREQVEEVSAGLSLDIPLGTTFQFRCTGSEPLRIVAATMPPWPGEDEAVLCDGPWSPSV
jgi:mannose-6-phosphate isomerase-like protein (cupin superfamily)